MSVSVESALAHMASLIAFFWLCSTASSQLLQATAGVSYLLIHVSACELQRIMLIAHAPRDVSLLSHFLLPLSFVSLGCVVLGDSQQIARDSHSLT